MAPGVSMGSGTLRFDVIDSVLGDVLIAASAKGVVRIAFGDRNAEAALEELDASPLGAARRDARAMRPATRQIREYLHGDRCRFDVEVDLSGVRGFTRAVLDATAGIPYGSVETYGDVAAEAGNPRAARAAGNALRGNPIPILIPCHRVVPSSGGIGGYGGQEAHKAYLLDLESAGNAPRSRRRERMEV
jgi:methylated-DNA-[protein]-cysteine S-methyltransferase